MGQAFKVVLGGLGQEAAWRNAMTRENLGSAPFILSRKQAGRVRAFQVLKIQFIDSFSECLLSICSGLEAELGSGDNDDDE